MSFDERKKQYLSKCVSREFYLKLRTLDRHIISELKKTKGVPNDQVLAHLTDSLKLISTCDADVKNTIRRYDTKNNQIITILRQARVPSLILFMSIKTICIYYRIKQIKNKYLIITNNTYTVVKKQTKVATKKNQTKINKNEILHELEAIKLENKKYADPFTIRCVFPVCMGVM